MLRKAITLCLACLAVAAALVTGACAAPEPPQGIIVIGWDGAQRAHAQEMLAAGELPALAALSAEGSMVEVDVNAGATDTKTGWTQILTGYAPDKTGVYSNSKYQPIPEGYSVFERVETFFGPDNIVTMAIVGKKDHVDADPPRKVPYEKWLRQQKRGKAREQRAPGQTTQLNGGQLIEENGEKFVLIPGKPWLNAKGHMDLFQNGLIENDKVGETALAKLDEVKDKRFLLFVHFAEPDHSGHKNGENSQEYSNGIKSDDEWTGKIIARLKELGVYDKTLVYVAVDHGFNEGTTGHRYAPYVFLGTNDNTFVRTQGDRADIGATVLKRFGMDLSTITPALDGIPYDEQAAERRAPAEKPAAPKAGKRKGGAARQPRQQPAVEAQ